MDTTALAQAVMDYATDHYEDGGWDVLVECWTAGEIVICWEDRAEFNGVPLPTTEAEAVDSMRGMVDVWADRQADARNSAF